MKKNSILIALALFSASRTWAGELPKDTLKVIDVEEIVVIAAPKENRKLRELPTAVTMLSQQDMQANQVNSIKSLTALVPNIFIPDYGSRLTSAIYIRGIGSRINTPSVGLYVDNVPYIDKSAFDFNYADIERIDVLRGPQGTLYGRNTMGGQGAHQIAFQLSGHRPPSGCRKLQQLQRFGDPLPSCIGSIRFFNGRILRIRRRIFQEYLP